MRLTPSKDGIYTISYLYADATHFRESNSMEIDPNKSIVVKEAKFEDKKLNEQLMSSMLPLHSGEYFGWIGQLLMFIASSLMALFVITGYMLYFDRWKKKRAKALKRKNKLFYRLLNKSFKYFKDKKKRLRTKVLSLLCLVETLLLKSLTTLLKPPVLYFLSKDSLKNSPLVKTFLSG